VVIALRGELDLSHAELLRQRLGEAQPADDVIVDVSGVPFIDSVVLGILARAAVHHRDHDGRLVLSGARPFVRKLLAITRLGGVLPDASTVDQARALLETYSDQAPAGSDDS
jgi:anti-anti-sigma factor